MLTSLSGVGCCYDNAPMESFWGTLKTELVYRQHYRTRAQAKTAIFAYIEGWVRHEAALMSGDKDTPRLVSKPVPISGSVTGEQGVVKLGETPKKWFSHQTKSG
jgi:transposase InsO family protein